MKKVPFNIPCSIGNEPELVRQAIENRHLSGNGPFTREVHRVFEEEMGYRQVLMTNSCTSALEMAAILCAFEPGDEVILPSFTHPGTANAFERAGARLVFADSLPHHPNIDPAEVRALAGPRTKAIVVVHYAGVACEMDELMEIAEEWGALLIEDAAHAIGATYKGRLLGSLGHLGAYSFHETKNITSGQGGLLMVNDASFEVRARRIWQYGTNRDDFYKGLVDQYTWVDLGACFLPSDMNAAYLSGQLTHREDIFSKRMGLWKSYWSQLSAPEIGLFSLPWVQELEKAEHNAHIFYLSFRNKSRRDQMLNHLNADGYGAVFHYVPLHSSPYFLSRHGARELPNCTRHSETLLRLPLFHSLRSDELENICNSVMDFVQNHLALS